MPTFEGINIKKKKLRKYHYPFEKCVSKAKIQFEKPPHEQSVGDYLKEQIDERINPPSFIASYIEEKSKDKHFMKELKKFLEKKGFILLPANPSKRKI